jgi:hypothetical protein
MACDPQIAAYFAFIPLFFLLFAGEMHRKRQNLPGRFEPLRSHKSASRPREGFGGQSCDDAWLP